ncbi:MAG: hypothetical protein KAT62_04365 [Desulfuromonadales bacterium]|nr:hypothetical protein [Desulfuromonadales bacterium]
MKYLLRFFFLLFLTAILSGCFGAQQLQTRMMATAQPDSVCRMAVLPFDNWTNEEQAGVVAQRIFYGALVNSGAFEVRPEGDVSLFRLRHRLAPGALLGKFHFTDLQEKLQIDAIVQGRLTEVGSISGRGADEVPVVAMQLQVYDVRRGELLLSTFHHRWGDDYRKVMHFGTVTTLTGLFDRMSDEIIADWIERGLGNCQ